MITAFGPAARWTTALGWAGCAGCAREIEPIAWRPCPVLAEPAGPVSVSATRGTLTTPFRADLDGHGSRAVRTLAFAGNAGTLALEGQPLPAVIYQTTSPLEPGVTASLAGVAVAPTYLVAFWVLCAGDELHALWHEETDGRPLRREPLEGACRVTATPTLTSVALPASAVRFPVLACDVEASGPLLQIRSSEPGSVTLPADLIRPISVRFGLFGFQAVDCWHNPCAPDRRWYELHALLSDGDGRAGFGVFYLSPGEHAGATVALSPVFSFGDAGLDPLETTFDAQWRVATP
jgi:hypothetical protein